MCPVCIATAAVIAASATSTGGISALGHGQAPRQEPGSNQKKTSNKERDMDKNKETEMKMKTPPIVSPQEWEAAREQTAREGEGLDPLP